MSPIRIAMMGTGTFAEPTFEAMLAAYPGEVVGLVTQPARATGRRSGATRQTGTGMAEIAGTHGIPVLQPENINSDDGLRALRELEPHLLVVAAYGQILKPAVLAIPRLGAINVHASLLPKYRGAAPVAHAILNGETETGVTIIRITPGLDAGDMLARESLQIGENETTGELEQRLAVLGARLCMSVISQIRAGTAAGTPQDAALVTKSPKITKEMGRIDWSLPGVKIFNHIRAMQPWPTAYSYLHRPGKPPLRVIILEAEIVPGVVSAECGTIAPPLAVQTGDGALQVRKLQLAGKKPVAAEEFLRGHPLPAGAHFGPESP